MIDLKSFQVQWEIVAEAMKKLLPHPEAARDISLRFTNTKLYGTLLDVVYFDMTDGHTHESEFTFEDVEKALAENSVEIESNEQ